MSEWRNKSLWSISSRFVGAGLSFLLNVLLARAMSQEDLGLFFLSLSLSWGGSLVCQWGASTLAVKWVAQARSRGDDASVSASAWSLIGFTLMHSIAAAAVVMSLNLPYSITVVWAAWTLSIGLQNLLPEILRGFEDLKWASLLAAPIPQGVSVLLIAGAGQIIGSLTFDEAAAIVIFGNLLSSAVGAVLVLRRAKFTLDFKAYRSFLRETTPIALSLAATYLMSQSDLWVCGVLFEPKDVAIYGVGQRFVAFVSMPMMILGSVASPVFAALVSEGQLGKLNDLLYKSVRLTSAASISILFAGALVGYPLIKLLFGQEYSGSFNVFFILGAGQVIHALAGPNGYLLLMSGEQRAAMRATASSALILLASAWLLGQKFGMTGVAAASTFALTVQTIWMHQEVKHRLKLKSHLRLSQ